MAQQQNSLIDNSRRSEMFSRSSRCRAMRFEESDVRDDNSLSDSVSKSTELSADKLADDPSFCDDVSQSTELVADKLHRDESVVSDDVCQSTTELVADKFSEFEAKKSSTDALVESQYQDSVASSDSHRQWHSTPSVRCCNNPSARSPAVSGRLMQNCECENKSLSLVGTKSSSPGRGDEENVMSGNSPVCCPSAAAPAVADGGKADDDVVLGCNKDASPTSSECKTVEDSDDGGASAHESHPRVELIAAASAAVTTSEDIACDNSDKVHADFRMASDVKNSQRHPSETTESVCLELSEMMRECMIVDDAGKQVLNSTASDVDISDSFDLDVAAKDLERAVSAGMLDFLLESYEDSDEDVNVEPLAEELDEWSPDDDVGDDDDDGGGDGNSSESTLAESPTDDSDGSVVVDDADDDDNYKSKDADLADANIDCSCTEDSHSPSLNTNDTDDSIVVVDDDDDDDGVLRRHERIKRHMKSIGNRDIDDHSAANVDPITTNFPLLSDVRDDDGDGYNTEIKDINDGVVLNPHERIEKRLNTSAYDNVSHTTDADISTVDIICVDDDDDDDDDDVLARHERVKRMLKGAAPAVDDDSNCKTRDAADDHKPDVKDIGDDAMLKLRERVKKCLNSSDYDNVSHTADADISTVDIIRVDDDYDDDDVLTRHERVKRLLKCAAPAADDDDNYKLKNADLADVSIECSCIEDDSFPSLHWTHLMNADDIDDSNPAGAAAGVTCIGDAHLAVTKDSVSMSEQFVFMPNNDGHVVEQSVPCRNVETMSLAVECSRHDELDKPDTGAVSDPAPNAQSAVGAGIRSPCTQQPSDVQNTDTRCNFCGETSLSVGDLGADLTSTPSTCSHHSRTRSAIEWQEGIYNGLCRHSDGSEIRMSCVTNCEFF